MSGLFAFDIPRFCGAFLLDSLFIALPLSVHSPSCNGISLGVVRRIQFSHPLAPGTLLFHCLRQRQTLVGGLLDMQLGIRVIASTHIDLDAAVEVDDSARRRMTA